jgi:high-affinity Fe2+/Pb2+ permease
MLSPSTPRYGVKHVWRAAGFAWIAGVVCGAAISQFLADMVLGGRGLIRGGLGLLAAAGLTLSAYFLIRAALNSRE